MPWHAVVAKARGERVSAETLGNLVDVVAVAQGQLPPPEVAAGYWPTVLLSWAGLSLEIFEDRIEVYPPTPPGKAIAVWSEPHLPGQELSPAFQTVLATVGPSPDATR